MVGGGDLMLTYSVAEMDSAENRNGAQNRQT